MERNLQMTSRSTLCGLALGAAGAVALAGMSPSSAAPVLSSTAGLKAAVADNIVDVQWRRWHHRRGAGFAAGVAAGVLAGAAIGAVTAPRYYYGPAYYPGYYYGPGYRTYAYGAPITFGGPVYGSVYPFETCPVDAGYGRVDYSQC
jgi:hypothetical protein